MGETTWTAYGSETIVLSTGLNSLADGSSATGSEIDNTTALDMFLDIEVYLASVDLSGQTAPYVTVHRIASTDGTNYEDTSAAPAFTALIAETSAAHRVLITGVPMTPGKMKLVLTNNTGAALAASGNTVKYRAYSPTTA